jgi:cellulose synthase (UDP-forming)
VSTAAVRLFETEQTLGPSSSIRRQRPQGRALRALARPYRRAALDANGGRTLIEHSEDNHTGFDLRRHSWRLRYVPVNLATGLCPDNLSGFFLRQQYRWCMGSLSLYMSRKFWRAQEPIRTRMCYLVGFAYYISPPLG